MEQAFTKCPVCEKATKARKFALVIRIDPKQLFILNMQCKFCQDCDLIIAKKDKVESMMAAHFRRLRPEIIGNKYLIMGTLDRQDWRQKNQEELSPSEIMERMFVFKDVWHFDVIPAGWYSADEK